MRLLMQRLMQFLVRVWVRSSAAALLLVIWPVGSLAQEWVVLAQGVAAGALKRSTEADGTVATDYSYRNNGRGPDVRETWRLDAQGVVTRYQASGRATMGAEIRESFQWADGRARWQSTVDTGDEPADPGTWFVGLDASPAYYAQLAAALLRRPDAAAPALGGLPLRAERLDRLTVTGPDGPVPLVLVALMGVDVMPYYLWLRDEPTLGLFGLAEAGWALMPRGFEASQDSLRERKGMADTRRLASLQQRLAKPLPGLTLIRAVRWFDSRAAVLRGPSDVYLADGRISAITATGALDARPSATVDGSGHTLLPGLFDMHGHVSWPWHGLFHLVGGVTSVRDLGSPNDELAQTRARIDSGEIAGTRIHATGFLEGASPYSARMGIVADNLQAARAGVDWYAARGYRQIKLYNSIRPEWVPPLVAHIKARGLRISGHIPAFMRAEQAVRAGYDEVNHINQVLLNFVSRPGDDSRTLLRFTRVSEDARLLRLDSPQVRSFLRLLRERGTTVDPTLTIFHSMFTQAQGEPDPAFAEIADHLPTVWRRAIKRAAMDLQGERLQNSRESARRMAQLVRAMHDAGITLVAGTDSFPGAFTLQRELQLYVQAGIPSAQVLRMATWRAAQLTGTDSDLGSIEVGKRADLLLVAGDPTQHITDLRRAALVVKGGTAYLPAEISEALGLKAFAPAAPIVPAALAASAR